MTTTPSPYAHILHAIADGLNVQWQDSAGRWNNQPFKNTLREISHSEYAPARYRVHAPTITINGREVPEPLREMPTKDTEVFWPAFGPDSINHTESGYVSHYPNNLPILLQQGLLHLTPEAASAHAQALISLTASK